MFKGAADLLSVLFACGGRGGRSGERRHSVIAATASAVRRFFANGELVHVDLHAGRDATDPDLLI